MEQRRALYRMVAFLLVCLLFAFGCATTTGGGGGPAPIPEGMGRLILEAGGINELNFYVIDQDTDEEVYSDTPRLSASSPAYFERGSQEFRLMCDIPPGLYTVVVNTDIDDNVEVRDVQIGLGEDRYIPVRVGRFSVRFSGGENLGRQVPFLIMDYNMRTVLGKGMTSSELRYFVVPAGRSYKVRIENSPTGLDEIRPVEVTFGGITHITIESGTQQMEEEGGTGTE